MNVTLTKHIFGELEIAPSRSGGVYSPNSVEGVGLSDEEIGLAINNPYGMEPLSKAARGSKSVLIVTDDNTRATPLTRLLPPILRELKKAGVPNDAITFLIGLGTHRAMTRAEIGKKFGAEISSTYRIVNHAWNDPDALVSLGTCELGFDIVVNKLALETDLMISVGNIVPHATAGFSGGGKTIMPGVCGEKTIEETHWMALDYSMDQILGQSKNPIRDAIDGVCRKVGLTMIVNTVLFHGSRIYGVVAGDLELAHQKGTAMCRQVYEVPIKEKAGIVIAEAYPTDIDLRQAIKAICSADIVCRDGGVVILPAECPDGISPQFPDFSRHGFRDPDGLYEDVTNGRCGHKLLAYTLVAIGRIISRRLRTILVSPNIDGEQAERMGFLWAPNVQEAMTTAFRITGKDSKVMVLKQAGELLPAIQS